VLGYPVGKEIKLPKNWTALIGKTGKVRAEA
jgi:hypothetical protein